MTRAPRFVLALILVAFTLVEIDTCIRKGERPLRRLDAQSEKNSSEGARQFLRDGFFATSFLPRYEESLNLDSGSPAIRESDIYTHYFPGPDYVLAASYALFGSEATVFQWTRLIPLAHVLVSVLLFVVAAERKLWPDDRWITPLLALLVLLPPAMREWAISLHGHAYTSAYVLLGLALGLSADDSRHRLGKIAAAFALGFLSNYMLLTAAFVVCAAPLSGSLLSPRRSDHRLAFALSGAIGLGLVAAFGVHYLQIANQFGWNEARLDQFGVLAVRSGAASAGTSGGDLFDQYQTDVARFFGLSPLLMLLIGFWGGLCQPGPLRARLNPVLAVTLASAASWAWIFLMREHALKHGHVNPRIFLLVYVCSLASAGAVAATRRLR